MAKEKKKRPVAHNQAIALLNTDPVSNLGPIIKLYQDGTVVPLGDIERFDGALGAAHMKLSNRVRALRVDLGSQKEEAKAKKQKKLSNP